ncbi:MAG: ATP-binding protein [Candidatus Acidiferrum sp.]|jgi:signal transduction histidine kinase
MIARRIEASFLAIVVSLTSASIAHAQAAWALTRVSQVRALTPEQAGQQFPVRILVNLATNAIGARSDGIIDVHLDAIELTAANPAPLPYLSVGCYVCLVVGDNGCGMDHGTLERIFDPFFTTKV